MEDSIEEIFIMSPELTIHSIKSHHCTRKIVNCSAWVYAIMSREIKIFCYTENTGDVQF